MRKVIYSIMASLDGFIEGPNRELDWAIIDEEFHRYVNDQEKTVDTHLYGRRMYEVMSNFWPTADMNPSAPEYIVEYARIWKNMQKIVFSRTLQQVEGNTRLIREIDVEEIRKLKEQPGKDLALGGAEIASTFRQLGLIDEYWLYIHPVLLGGGTPLFRTPSETVNLRLLETHTFNSGVVFLRYQRAHGG